MKKEIKDVQIGDEVLGTDMKWYKVIDKTTVKLSYNMYEVQFDNGSIRCSNVHQWNVFIDGKMYTTDTEGFYQEFDWYKGRHTGTADGPILVGIKKIPPEYVVCITTDAPDHQFAIYVDQNKENTNE